MKTVAHWRRCTWLPSGGAAHTVRVLQVHYAPADEPHHIVLLQSTTGLKRPIGFGALNEAACPFTYLHVPYSWHCCQTNATTDVSMTSLTCPVHWAHWALDAPRVTNDCAHPLASSPHPLVWH
jgi:hypothetical protein